ncbi:MAG TPA: MBG domain-containing protein, partial [Wenzhouxiangella sp.]|nr:MBG domain-containing protein [Wenzhouxiangella sp.]
ISISGDSQFTLTGSGNCASGDTLNGGDDCTVEVSFDPDAAASFSGSLDINSDAGDASAALGGTGILPDWSDRFEGAFDEPDWQFFAFDGTSPLYTPETAQITNDYLQINDPTALYAGGYIPRSFGEARVAALVNADGTNTGTSPDNQIDQGVLSHFDPDAQEGYAAYMRMEATYQDLVLVKFDAANFDPALIDERVRVADDSDGDWSMDRMYVVELDVVDQGGGQALLIARAFDADTGALLATVEATDTAAFGPGYGGLVAITNSTGVNGTFDTASGVSSFASAGLSHDLIDFGQVEAHAISTPSTVTISNDGNADLTISDLSLAGADAAQFAIGNDNCSGTVTAGASCTFEVSFSPDSVGARSAEVLIESSASTSVDIVVLEGEGIPAQATVTLSDLIQTYDGNPKPATVTTTPAGLSTVVTYDGASTAPVNAGSYTVEANIAETDYTGSATGTLEIEAADQTIAFPAVADRTVDDSPFTVSATASSGLPVSFSIVSGPATVSGDQVTLDGVPGQVTIAADQAGDGNWNAAPTVQQSFQVTEGEAASIEATSATTITGEAGEPIATGDLPTVRVLDS